MFDVPAATLATSVTKPEAEPKLELRPKPEPKPQPVPEPSRTETALSADEQPTSPLETTVTATPDVSTRAVTTLPVPEEKSQVSLLETSEGQNTSAVIFIGISGAPASGKTTLAHLLANVLSLLAKVIVIHQDDYGTPGHLLVPDEPINEGMSEGMEDSESDEVLDMATFRRLCRYTQRQGRLPLTFRTRHDEEGEEKAALTMVGESDFESLQALILQSMCFKKTDTLVIVEGPQLYHDRDISDILHVKLFLRTDLLTARSRRLNQQRQKYLGGDVIPFWLTKDYFDDIVWSDYIKKQGPFFTGNNVERIPLAPTCNRHRIRMQPTPDSPFAETLCWAVEMIVKSLGRSIVTGRQVPPENIQRSNQGILVWLERVRCALYDAI